MIRALSLAAGLAAAFVLPVAAQDATMKAPADATVEAPALRGNLFTEDQARLHLSKTGFVDISTLTKDSNGAWSGTATKDGKTMTVAVDVKGNVRKN